MNRRPLTSTPCALTGHHPAGMSGTTATSMTESGGAARCTARARSNGSQVGAAPAAWSSKASGVALRLCPCPNGCAAQRTRQQGSLVASPLRACQETPTTLPTLGPTPCAGERYDGEWLEGQESGVGVFTWQDGSTYEGFWLNGRKDGVGVFRPAPHTQGMPGSDPSVRHLAERQPAGVSDGASPPHSPVVQAASPDLPLDSPAAAGRAVRQLTSLPQGERLGVWDAVGQLIACPNVIAARVRQHRCKATSLQSEGCGVGAICRRSYSGFTALRRRPPQHWCRRLLSRRRPGVRLPVSAGYQFGPCICRVLNCSCQLPQLGCQLQQMLHHRSCETAPRAPAASHPPRLQVRIRASSA